MDREHAIAYLDRVIDELSKTRRLLADPGTPEAVRAAICTALEADAEFMTQNLHAAAKPTS